MIILGMDPGSRLTGFGLVRKTGNRVTHIENGTLYLQDFKKYTDRLVYLHQEIKNLIEVFRPDALVVENIFYHKNPKSIQKLGEVRGVILLSGAVGGLTVFEYTPLEVKKAVTGYGNATKQQMQFMVCKLLGLRDTAEENASDALGVALCHAQSHSPLNTVAQEHAQKRVSVSAARELLKKASFYR